MTDHDAELVRGLRELPTTVVSDVLGDLGYDAQVLSLALRPVISTQPSFCGPAFTVSGVVSPETGPDLRKSQAIDEMPAGAVAVWAGNGVEGVCMFGDLLATGMLQRGVVGAVVDGGVRDSVTLAEIVFPVHARYVTPKASTDHWRVQAVNEPVTLPGVLQTSVETAPGDLVLADADGVVVIPAAVASTVLARGSELEQREGAIRDRVLAGESLADVMRDVGRI